MATVAELLVKIAADTKNFAKGMQETQKNLGATATKFQATGQAMVGTGKVLTTGLTAPIAAIGVVAGKMAVDFNKSMANVATLIPGNIDRINELKKSVQDTAVLTAKSTDDLAGGLYQVISAFGDSADTAKILEINAKSAAAGLANTTDAINLTSAVTKGYGDTSAAAVQKVSDLAFQSVKLGQTTFQELSSSLGRVVPLTSSLGVSMEELFGVMATGTGVTGSASEVSTQLRGILQSLMAPTKGMTDLLSNLGYASGEAMIKELGLQNTINKIVESAKATGAPLQDYIGSIEGQTLAVALAGPQAEAFTKKLKDMQKVAGATEEAFKEQTEGVNAFGFEMQKLKQTIIVTAQQLGQKLIPTFKKITDDVIVPFINSIKKVVEWFAALDDKTRKTILTFIGIAAAIGPVLIIVGKIITIIGSLIKVFSVLKAVAGVVGIAIGAISAPVAIAIAIIGALIVIGGLVIKNWAKVKAKAIEIWGAIANWFINVKDKIVNAITGLVENAKAKFNALPGIFKVAFMVIAASIAPLITLGILLYKNWDMIKAKAIEVWGAVSNWFNRVKAVGTNAITGLVNGIKNGLNRLPSIFTNIFNSVLGYLSRLPSMLYNKAKNMGSSLWSGFKNALGINSPSYIDEAFFTMIDSANSMLKGVSAIVPKFSNEMGKLANPIMPMTDVRMATAAANGVGVGIPTGAAQQTGYVEGDLIIDIAQMVVRDDSDIEKIAQKLYRLQQSRTRGKGGKN